MTSTSIYTPSSAPFAKPYYTVPEEFAQREGFINPSEHFVEAWLALDVKGNAGFNFKGTLFDALAFGAQKHVEKGSSSHHGPFVLRPSANSNDPEYFNALLFPFSSRSVEFGDVTVLPAGRFHENFDSASFLWFEFDGLTKEAEEDLFEHLLGKKLAFIAHTSKSHNPNEEFGHKWHIFVPLQRSVRYPEYVATMQKLTSELPASCVVDKMSERFTQGAAIPRVYEETAQWSQFLAQPGALLAPEKAELEEVVFTKHLAQVAYEKGLIEAMPEDLWKEWLNGYSGKTDNDSRFRDHIQAILHGQMPAANEQLVMKALKSIVSGAAALARRHQKFIDFDSYLWEPILKNVVQVSERPSEKVLEIHRKTLASIFEASWKTQILSAPTPKNREPLMRITPVNAAYSVQFVTQYFEHHPNPITARLLWEEYVGWSKANNLTYRPIKGFGKALKEYMDSGRATFEKYTVKGQSKYRLKERA